MIYEWTLGAFHQWTGLAVNDFCYTLDGRLLGAVNGFIIQFNVGYKDYGNKAIEFVVKTKPFNLDYPFHKKRITRLYISFRQPPEQGDDDPTITAKITVDNETQEFIQEKAISENFVWGSEWGRIWGYQELITSRIRVSESGHRVQMEFENKQLNKSCTEVCTELLAPKGGVCNAFSKNLLSRCRPVQCWHGWSRPDRVRLR